MFEALSSLDLAPFWLSFKLAFWTTTFLFFISLPLAWYLSQTKSRAKPFIETLTALPLVLPPSVMGFYLLVLFSQSSPLGSWLQTHFGVSLVFSFWGLVVASCIYSLPFMVQPLQSGFESLDRRMLEASLLSGKSPMQTLFHVALPNIKPALLTALVVTFAHTVGEFGVVLMVGGSIPHETKVASVAIYEMVEMMDYEKAHLYAGLMLLLSFIVLLLVYIFQQKQDKKFTGGLS